MGYLNEIIFWIITLTFWLGLLIVFVGAGFLALPDHMLKLSRLLNRWVSTDSLQRNLDSPHYAERNFYRYHRWVGAFIIFGCVYFIYTLATNGFEPFISMAPVIVNRIISQWIYESLLYISIMLIVTFLLIGFVILVRPSLLKSIEQLLNRWIGADKNIEALNREVGSPDGVIVKRPRLFGLVIMLGGIYMVLSSLAEMYK